MNSYIYVIVHIINTGPSSSDKCNDWKSWHRYMARTAASAGRFLSEKKPPQALSRICKSISSYSSSARVGIKANLVCLIACWAPRFPPNS